MDERYEELAALHALGTLENDEQRSLDGGVARDRELRSLVAELELTAADLIHAVAPVTPPADIKRRVRARIRSKRAGYTSGANWGSITGWAAAAVLGASAAWLWTDREKAATTSQTAIAEVQAQAQKLEQELEQERSSYETKVAQFMSEISALKNRDARAQMQIATLQSSVDAYKQGVAVVVWDSETHQGVLKLEKMPPVEAGKDYQLWVVDPKNPVPVDAGIVRVDSKGFAKVDFKPLNDVSEAAKFALSVEKEGGVPKGEGPIVLIGP